MYPSIQVFPGTSPSPLSRLCCLDAWERARRSAAIAARTGLLPGGPLGEVEAEDLAVRQIGTLSGGQLQRVLLARALAGEPQILALERVLSPF